ncbi:Fic family protein [Nesterenkonia muleiensis]|uniref:Fic family protein n=1 Tax=Nesterenkonia muleiensis TaxID=2282648 RepID=UPI000E738D2E|nr:Fic/DOC family N-terminal domain-containing protein [Nesterenkonia muleiensis]
MSPIHPTRWDPTQPYNELPALPPRNDVETRGVLKLLIEARSTLAAMDQAARRLPNPQVLLSTLTVLEAQASSEIENVVTTTDELFRHIDNDAGASPDVKEALRYRQGLFSGLDLVRTRGTITRVTAETICTELAGRHMGLRRTSGTIIADPRTRQAVYTPPEGYEILDRKMAEWERYVNGPGHHDPLIRMALAHYQFEAIHPFEDGNGRTGRIINILQLINDELLDRPVLYLSRQIIATKNEYYRLLREVTSEENFEDWIIYMLESVRKTAQSTLYLIDQIQELEGGLRSVMDSALRGAGSLALANVLMAQPYTRIKQVSQACGVTRQTASRWLSALVDANILERIEAGRDVLFLNPRYMRLLAEA